MDLGKALCHIFGSPFCPDEPSLGRINPVINFFKLSIYFFNVL